MDICPDFVGIAWSKAKRAAEAFNVKEKEVYEALAALSSRLKIIFKSSMMGER